MAARFTREQVLEQIFSSESVENESSDEEIDIYGPKEKLSEILEKFDVGEEFNYGFFKENAIDVLMPIVEQATFKPEPQRLKASHLLSRSTFSAASILRRESTLWVELIQRRLAGRVSIMRPYYAEIHRSIPYDIFAVIHRVIRNVDEESFCEPLCYTSGNKKAEVISFTSIDSVEKLFSLLSGINIKDLKKSFSRKLKGRRSGHKVELLVSEDKDFGFLYRKKSGQMDIQFHYAEWNAYGFPQHSCHLE